MEERHPHILIIDDDPDVSRLFGGKLATQGFEVMYASQGNEGRELARRFQPDLILLDMRLPGDDGMSVAERLKNERQTANIPIIFVTNEDLTEEAQKAVKEVWAVDYIHKSTDLNEFVRRVKAGLETVKAQDAGT
ncbi:MAG: response regulator [Candidatus Sungbacteria bacterium]|nr:response regulator [bacterium]MDZ4260087.1 response regulator [Candidatus Sungbacteria bacterium]